MNLRFVLCGALSLLLSVVLTAFGSEKAASSSGVPEHILVTVETPHGSNVPVIHREDVLVHEGRDRDKVAEWVPAQGDHAGLDLFILIDDASATSLGAQLEDLRRFITAQPVTTNVGVAYMEDGIAQVLQNLTSDHARAAMAVRLPLGFAGVNASPYLSLGDLIKRWPEGTARREVLMVSDGIDRLWGSGPDDPYADTAIEQAQRAGVIVFTIYFPGFGHYGHSFWRNWWGQVYLSRLGDETGGESYYIGFFGPPVSFVPYLDDVTSRLNRQWWLTFLAKSQPKAGMQRVKLATEVPNAELLSTDSVYVPASH